MNSIVDLNIVSVFFLYFSHSLNKERPTINPDARDIVATLEKVALSTVMPLLQIKRIIPACEEWPIFEASKSVKDAISECEAVLTESVLNPSLQKSSVVWILYDIIFLDMTNNREVTKEKRKIRPKFPYGGHLEKIQKRDYVWSFIPGLFP